MTVASPIQNAPAPRHHALASAHVSLTDAFPTGKDAIVPGCKLYVGLHLGGGARIQLGSAVVSALSADQFVVSSGQLSFSALGYGANGSFSFTLSSPDQGQTWSLTYSADIQYTSGGNPGTFNPPPGSIPVSASESGSGTDTTIAWALGSVTLTQSFQNDTLLQRAMVLLATPWSSTISLCFYNETAYGGSDAAQVAAFADALRRQ
jgi:hypothetical protein